MEIQINSQKQQVLPSEDPLSTQNTKVPGRLRSSSTEGKASIPSTTNQQKGRDYLTVSSEKDQEKVEADRTSPTKKGTNSSGFPETSPRTGNRENRSPRLKFGNMTEPEQTSNETSLSEGISIVEARHTTKHAVNGPGSGYRKSGTIKGISKKQLEFSTIFEELPTDEAVIEDYSCAYAADKILYHGRMYITTNYICFHSQIFKKTIKIVPFKEISDISKRNTALVIPNAIEIVTRTGKEHLFASFMHREQAYLRLRDLWYEARGITIVKKRKPPVEQSNNTEDAMAFIKSYTAPVISGAMWPINKFTSSVIGEDGEQVPVPVETGHGFPDYQLPEVVEKKEGELDSEEAYSSEIQSASDRTDQTGSSYTESDLEYSSMEGSTSYSSEEDVEDLIAGEEDERLEPMQEFEEKTSMVETFRTPHIDPLATSISYDQYFYPEDYDPAEAPGKETSDTEMKDMREIKEEKAKAKEREKEAEKKEIDMREIKVEKVKEKEKEIDKEKEEKQIEKEKEKDKEKQKEKEKEKEPVVDKIFSEINMSASCPHFTKITKEAVASAVIPMDFPSLFHHFLSDEKGAPFMNVFHEELGYTSPSISPWQKRPTGCCNFRQVLFVIHLNNPLGPKTARIVQDHRIKFVTPTHVVYATSSGSEDIPKNDCFSSESYWEIVSVGPNSVRMTVYCDVVFTQSTFLRGLIEKNSWNALREYFIPFVERIRQAAVKINNQKESLAVPPSTRKSRSSRSSRAGAKPSSRASSKGRRPRESSRHRHRSSRSRRSKVTPSTDVGPVPQPGVPVSPTTYVTPPTTPLKTPTRSLFSWKDLLILFTFFFFGLALLWTNSSVSSMNEQLLIESQKNQELTKRVMFLQGLVTVLSQNITNSTDSSFFSQWVNWRIDGQLIGELMNKLRYAWQEKIAFIQESLNNSTQQLTELQQQLLGDAKIEEEFTAEMADFLSKQT
eukprot:CAMPEP_0174254354 /NCGR_PEP_ID=MMETSP0439-20130205/3694_1 /TAXON_ID=0 /ORGANISM="Stereomyxa ramosa, Strain Chinc5" /LENGTH=953 /DNA_ID=CAMNT_0015335901 /DNA_START=16 /DNA_END=2877 /DNA_ORIENTATION=+